MADVFHGTPDARQSADPNHKVSRFRPTYRALTDAEKAFHDVLKAKAVQMETMIEELPPGDNRHDAMRSLELTVMWAVKALTQ